MRRTIWLALSAAFALTALTACMSDSNESTRGERAAALINAVPTQGGMQLTIDRLTPENKAIQVLTYSWGVEAGSPVGFRNLKFTKTMDATSPLLFRGAATGEAYEEAQLKLHLVNQNGQTVNYLTYTLRRVEVTSVEPGAAPVGGQTPHTEEVTLSFHSIGEVVSADHTGNISPVAFGWNRGTQSEERP